MSTAELPQPPPKSRIKVKPYLDGFQLILPLTDLRRSGCALVMGLLCSGCATQIQIQYAQHMQEVTVLTYGVLFCGSLFAALVFLGVNAWYRHAVLKIAGDQLAIHIVNLLWTRKRAWQRQELQWITGWEGLLLVSNRPANFFINTTLFAAEDPTLLMWIANTLREALQLQRLLGPMAGEIEIAWTSDPKWKPDRGFLAVKRGWLGVRYDFLANYQYQFFPAGQLDLLTSGLMSRTNAFNLEPDDIQCKIADDGTSCMLIRRSSWPQVQLTIWCDEQEVLQNALVRFWGIRELDAERP